MNALKIVPSLTSRALFVLPYDKKTTLSSATAQASATITTHTSALHYLAKPGFLVYIYIFIFIYTNN